MKLKFGIPLFKLLARVLLICNSRYGFKQLALTYKIQRLHFSLYSVPYPFVSSYNCHHDHHLYSHHLQPMLCSKYNNLYYRDTSGIDENLLGRAVCKQNSSNKIGINLHILILLPIYLIFIPGFFPCNVFPLYAQTVTFFSLFFFFFFKLERKIID